jgi:hypothetical protein
MKSKRQHKKSKKRISNKNRRKSYRRIRGGTCYGRGVGANNFDPNYTIYNTNLLKLFPYKP